MRKRALLNKQRVTREPTASNTKIFSARIIKANLKTFSFLYEMSGGRRSAPPGTISGQPPQPLVTQVPSGKTAVGRTPGEMKDHLQNQLSAVEKLQYQLTSHELQFAQRMAQKEQQAAEQVQVTVASSSSDSNDGECRF